MSDSIEFKYEGGVDAVDVIFSSRVVTVQRGDTVTLTVAEAAAIEGNPEWVAVKKAAPVKPSKED